MKVMINLNGNYIDCRVSMMRCDDYKNVCLAYELDLKDKYIKEEIGVYEIVLKAPESQKGVEEFIEKINSMKREEISKLVQEHANKYYKENFGFRTSCEMNKFNKRIL